MIDRRIIGLALAALLVFGLLTSLGFGTYRMGWSQGYLSGSIVANSAGGATDGPTNESAPQLAPRGYGYGYGPGLGHGHFFSPLFLGVGLFFKCGLFLLLFFLAAKFLRFGLWRMRGGPGGNHWAKHKRHWRDYWERDEPVDGGIDSDDPRANMI